MTHQLYYSDKHPTAFYPYSTLAPPNYHHHRLPLQHLTPLLPVVDDNTYHYSLPQRKIRISNSRPKLSRSLSTGSLRHLEEQQQHFINQGITEYPENVYNWYYQQQNEPQYIHSQRSTIKPKNRKRSKGREHNERNTLERNEDSDDRYDNNNSEYNIDPDVYTDIDGEPMNELELLAAKNAIRNETIFYDENDDKERTAKQVSSSSDRKVIEEQQQKPQKVLRNSLRSIDDDMIDESLSNAMKSLNFQHIKVDSAAVADNTFKNEEATSKVSNNAASNSNDDVLSSTPDQSISATTSTKKKRWPFSFLFKKGVLPHAKQQHQQQALPQHLVASASTPPTPALTPDYYSKRISATTSVNNYSYDGSILSSSSTGSSLLSVSPFQQQRQLNPNASNGNMTTTVTSDHYKSIKGSWYFKFLTPFSMTSDTWHKFDQENQHKLSDYIESVSLHSKTYPIHQSQFNHYPLRSQNQLESYHLLQISDSHLGQGNIPIVILPFHQIGFYCINDNVNQLAYLELKYIPPSSSVVYTQ